MSCRKVLIHFNTVALYGVLKTPNLHRDPIVEAVTMDPPMIPIPGTASSRPPRSSHSSSPRKRPQHSDYPPADNNASHGLMSGGRAPGTGPVPVPETSPANKTRSNPPADNAAGKPSKSSKRKKNRNRKRRNRHQSFIPPSREESHDSPTEISDAGGVRGLNGGRSANLEGQVVLQIGPQSKQHKLGERCPVRSSVRSRDIERSRSFAPGRY